MRGRKPTPTPILATRGSWRAKVRHGEPEPPAGRPEPPAYVSADPVALAEWEFVCGQLEAMGTLAAVHRATIASYCLCVSRLTAAQEVIRASGMSQDGKSGRKKLPEVTIAERAVDQLRALAAELAITPTSQSRARTLTPAEKPVANGKARLFRG